MIIALCTRLWLISLGMIVMEKFLKRLSQHALLGAIAIPMVLSGIGISSLPTWFFTGTPYPLPTEIITTPNGPQGSSKLYLPVVSKVVPPLSTTSWYMETKQTEMYFNLGCQLGYRDRDLNGTQDSIVILDFDHPTYINGKYGANLFGHGPITTTEITIAVEYFGIGYYNCVNPDRNSTLTIAVGTNNCKPELCAGSALAAQYYAHGAAWATMVNQIGSYFVNNNYFPQVRAYGASDMEVGWNDPYTTKQWVDGYDSINNWPMFNFGDAQGCPQFRTIYNTQCDNSWYQYSIWYISGRGGLNSSVPLPLIYDNDGANGRQWYSLSAYGYDFQNGKLNIQGAVTMYLVCTQRGCPPDVDNTPEEGYIDLYSAINFDPITSQALKWSTDFGYSGY
jgi:hypothetical protein